MKIMVINGVNMNMLGFRDTTHYGTLNYQELLAYIADYTQSRAEDVQLTFLQSNFEGEIVEYIHCAIKEKYTGIVINPAAFSHYSYAIHDALEMFTGLKVEVHFSDVLHRDEFRKQLVTAKASDHMIFGKQAKSYTEGIDWILTQLNK